MKNKTTAAAAINRENLLRPVRRMVIKIGTRVLAPDNNTIDIGRVKKIAKEIAGIHQLGIDTIIVSSGAVGLGMGALGIKKRPQPVPKLQATAAVGQNRLVHLYETVFNRYRKNVGQVLLTGSDLQNRKSYVNVRNTLLSLLDYKVIPVINENDSVGIEELQPKTGRTGLVAGVRFGDNDTLSAQITNLVEADLLVILTDIDGFFSADPKKDKTARLIETVDRITPQLEKRAGREGSLASVGGMKTKLKAARIVVDSGRMMIIANGRKDSLQGILKGERVGTLFLPGRKKMSSRQQWIAFTSQSRGELTVDQGAYLALVKKGKSLLPSGITGSAGSFTAGDYVVIKNTANKIFAKGKILFSSGQIKKVMGKKSAEVRKLLGKKKWDEAVHRDHLVIL